MRILFLFLFVSTVGISQPTKQSKCNYWLKYFSRIAKCEKEKLKALEVGDVVNAEYYGSLIRRDMEDVNDDYLEQDGGAE